jgi:hypothetical protein
MIVYIDDEISRPLVPITQRSRSLLQKTKIMAANAARPSNTKGNFPKKSPFGNNILTRLTLREVDYILQMMHSEIYSSQRINKRCDTPQTWQKDLSCFVLRALHWRLLPAWLHAGSTSLVVIHFQIWLMSSAQVMCDYGDGLLEFA